MNFNNISFFAQKSSDSTG